MFIIEYQEFLDFLEQIGEMIAETFGDECEVAISDINKPESAILYIFNGHVTGRKVGDPLSSQAVERISGAADSFYINYSNEKAGKNVKSSTLEFNLGEHRLAMCINYDCSVFLPMQRFLEHFTDARQDAPSAPGNPMISSVETVIEKLIADYGKPPRLMSKDDRLAVVDTLNKQGIFNFQKSVITVAKLLGISRFTVYNYLNELNGAASGSDANQ